MPESANTTIKHNKLEINQAIYDLVMDEIIPQTGIQPDDFWNDFEQILSDFMPRNKALLETRDSIQAQIDNWHKSHGEPHDPAEYESFLREINYLSDPVDEFTISTKNVDPEICQIAGPQLVVPINNARFSLNATNARWGSLFDAYYGTDVIPETEGLEKGKAFNPKRGKKVIELATRFLDQVIPLTEGSHKDVSAYTLLGSHNGQRNLQIYLQNGHIAELKHPEKFIGYQDEGSTCSLLFKNNDLHLEIQIDPLSPIGKTTLAGLKDIILEAAITTIQDCEDSVTAVDAEDKALVYRNWLGLMKGDLEVVVNKGGKQITRSLNPDRQYKTPDGDTLNLSARSLLMVRNVGHLMTSDAIHYNGEAIPEGIMDGMITSLAFLHDYHGKGRFKNSASNSLYIVKPKMHGPDEVRFSVDLFARIEKALILPENTLKIGIMDEERRTSVNLRACIHEAKERLIFINTGFLDRTGDEIHTSMEAGTFLNKDQIKKEPWIEAYEDRNVDVGLQCGLPGKAQIGKGMWAMPDLMAEMLEQKIQHPLAGANCAWVPSPTAATLHATHYHQVYVPNIQKSLAQRPMASLQKLLTIPLALDNTLRDVQDCLDNNTQSILGYVVRWIDQGIGCSKVPDTHHVNLMEDRATLRISSQLLANWLYHDIISEEQLIDSFKKMAKIVDKQNEHDPFYQPMSPDYNGIAFQAAVDLVTKGRQQPNGYTEPLLHAYRQQQKQNSH